MAVVASENADNWKWFLEKLKTHAIHDREVMFISDRAGGLLHAFKDVYARPLHFFCLYHLMKNLKCIYSGKKYSEVYRGYMCKLLKDAAYAPSEYYFNIAMAKFLEKGGDKAAHFIQDLPKDKWAVAFAPDVHRYGELTSNAAESFNNWILGPRTLPVTFMLDQIRAQMMRWFNERREAAAKWTGALTPAMEDKWNAARALSGGWTVSPTNEKGVYEVQSTDSVVVCPLYYLNHLIFYCW